MGVFRSRPLAPFREPRPGWDPNTWASRVPLRKLDNFGEVFRAAWENRDRLGYAWRILNQGTCDGCALGTHGMRDWTVDGVHLCNVRLRLLRLNTLPELDPARLSDVAALRVLRARDLRALGRLPFPLLRRRGDPGFQRVGWDDAIDLVAERIAATEPDRTFLYLTSRGIPNETYYQAQKAMRAIGTNNVDNAARLCHAPSTVALKRSLGVGATTCSYADLIGSDVVTFIGSNPAKNQPVMMKYLYHAKKAGTKVVVVNPYRESGMDAYWVPSDAESALFGTTIADRFVQVAPGGDRAFLRGALKALDELRLLDEGFVADHTSGWDDLRDDLAHLDWARVERESGVPRAEVVAYAELIGRAGSGAFVWGMGLTHQAQGEENVQAVIDLALARGLVGRPGCGLMPIRGHSGVQGGAEMGAYATVFPGGVPIDPEAAAALEGHYGFPVPSRPGITTAAMIDAAGRGEIDVLLAVGGSFREVLPDPAGVSAALARVPLRVHFDLTLHPTMLDDPDDAVLLLPATTRYEVPGGVSQTSTERRVTFSPEVAGPRVAEARPEGDVLCEIAARVRPHLAEHLRFASTAAVRAEIARVIPDYAGSELLAEPGDQFQIGGPRLCEGGVFATPTGRARFGRLHEAPATEVADDPDVFVLITRRGKQFNSIVHQDVDPLGGLARDAVVLAPAAAERLGLADGARVWVENDHGRVAGRVRVGPLSERAVMLHWPEANVLLDPARRSASAATPAYKGGSVRVRAAPATAGGAVAAAAPAASAPDASDRPSAPRP
ncbi:MAG: FdhF/YdeP family oxidoreductase [Trueperaceae bacterium]